VDTEIYYFSGTGNSLFVARELQKRIPDSKLVPIVNLLDKPRIKAEGKAIGIVFPCYALTLPVAVKRFVKKLDVQSADYIFTAVTRLGTVFRGLKTLDRLLAQKKKKLDAHFVVNMCNNEGPRSEIAYEVPTKARIQQVESAVIAYLDNISPIIRKREAFRGKDDSYTISCSPNPVKNLLIEKLVVFGMNLSEYVGGVNYFYHDEKCNGCGICEKVCLSGKIRVAGRQAVWQKNTFCYMCYACLNFCPQQSVQVGSIPGVASHTAENGRYPHPYATVKDIASQKSGS